MEITDEFSATLVLASFYIYFVALAGGLGLLTAAGIGYKLYNRSKNKTERKTGRKGAVRNV